MSYFWQKSKDSFIFMPQFTYESFEYNKMLLELFKSKESRGLFLFTQCQIDLLRLVFYQKMKWSIILLVCAILKPKRAILVKKYDDNELTIVSIIDFKEKLFPRTQGSATMCATQFSSNQAGRLTGQLAFLS